MTNLTALFECIPAKAGIHLLPVLNCADRRWTPAFAGAQDLF